MYERSLVPLFVDDDAGGGAACGNGVGAAGVDVDANGVVEVKVVACGGRPVTASPIGEGADGAFTAGKTAAWSAGGPKAESQPMVFIMPQLAL